MKRINTANGSSIVAYEFGDLSQEAQDKAICEYIDFEMEIMDEDSPYYYLVEEMERKQTPWFLGEVIYEKHLEDIKVSIEINQHLFDEDGDFIVGILYHTRGSEIIKTTYKGKECKIIDIKTPKQ